MRKSRVFQFKLTDEEFEELHQKAGDLGMNASQLIRERVGLGREPEPVKERPAKASVEEPRPVGSTPTPSADAPGFKRLVAQIQGKKGCSPKEAEAEARERLGME